jgi:hypothetical protein
MLCTAPASKPFPRYLRVVVVVGVVDTVDKWSPCRSGPVFYPPRLWVTTVDNQGPLWTAGSCAHPVHRATLVLPRSVPRNTPVLPRPTHPLGVTPFTLPRDRPHFVTEQWTKVWRTGPELCTTDLILWASGGQPEPGAVGQLHCPQSVDSGCPHIPNRLSCGYRSQSGQPVESIGTTPVSPGCGRGDRCFSVEKSAAVPCNRTAEPRKSEGDQRCGDQYCGSPRWTPLDNRERPGRRAPGARGLPKLQGGPGQLLMRLVSSVTWL